MVEANVIVLDATGSTPKLASSEPHELLAELLTKLGHRADQALSQGNAGAPAKGCQAAHIQLFPGGAIGFAGVPEDFTPEARGLSPAASASSRIVRSTPVPTFRNGGSSSSGCQRSMANTQASPRSSTCMNSRSGVPVPQQVTVEALASAAS